MKTEYDWPSGIPLIPCPLLGDDMVLVMLRPEVLYKVAFGLAPWEDLAREFRERRAACVVNIQEPPTSGKERR